MSHTTSTSSTPAQARPAGAPTVSGPTAGPVQPQRPGTSQPGATPAGGQPLVDPRPAPIKRGVRPGVVVWGLIIVLLGVWGIVASSGLHLSAELALVVLLGLAGLTLVVSALVAAIRRPRA
ncbi:MAG: hypothetical protein LBJ62_01725 [Bifidobacteriaceae bacterium]|jgi:hypothetical protein|nr:hypothetical protein [Bifidobacteriaceae bacterium]